MEVETETTADQLIKRLLTLERSMGRKRIRAKRPRGKYRPRIIDLDLLFFNKEVIKTRMLEVPHPRLHERRFVLAPMAELAPTLMHPSVNHSISEMLAALQAKHQGTLASAE